MPPKAYIHHDLPGRLRVYIPSHKGVDEFFTQLHLQLGECDAIDGAHVNARTGSVLIYYSGERRLISEFASRNNLFSLHAKKQAHPKRGRNKAKTMSTFMEMLDQKIAQNSQGDLDLSFLTAGGLASLALFQAMNGRTLPPAWTLIAQAISALRRHPGGDKGERARIRLSAPPHLK